tara:strand:+ start:649 stop:882 length:234 start_codon:yes stop_codon:yes gene_type:complete
MISKEMILDWLSEKLVGAKIVVQGDDGAHFHAKIEYSGFKGLTKIKQHRIVYDALGERVGGQIHALSLTTLVPAEEI